MRGGLDICLELRILSIGLILTEFETTGTTEHHIDNTHITKCCNHPLPYCTAGADADNETSGPRYIKLFIVLDVLVESGKALLYAVPEEVDLSLI